jgi:tetratricopeptide (TPR) repeat protein
MAFRSADNEAAEALYLAALELFAGAGDARRAALVSGSLALVEQLTGRFDQSLERLETAFSAVSGDWPREDVATLAGRLAQSYAFAGALDKAVEPCELALEIAQALRLPEALCRSLTTKAQIAQSTGRPEEAIALLRHALRVALEHDRTETAVVAYGNLSDVCFQSDRYAEALEALSDALALARRIGVRNRELYLLAEISYVHSMNGGWQDALRTYGELPGAEAGAVSTLASVLSGVLEVLVHRGRIEEAVELRSRFRRLEGSMDLQDRAILAASSAALLFAEGRHSEALDTGLEAAGIAPDLGPGQQGVKQGFVWAVEAAIALGERERADELLAAVEGLAPGLRPPLLEAHAHRFRARLNGDEGGFKTAAARFRELEIPFWLAVTELDHGEWLVGQARPEEAEPLFAEAREIFERLEATPWLERVDSVAPARAARVGV